MGGVLQSVAQTEWMWGTRPDETDAVQETKDLLPQMTVGGQPLSSRPGPTDYLAAPVTVAYPLDNGGQKTVPFDDARVSVTVRHVGGFQERLPLLKRAGDVLTQAPGMISLRHGGDSFVVKFGPDAQVEIQPEKPGLPGMTCVMVVLKAHDQLTYTLAFEGNP